MANSSVTMVTSLVDEQISSTFAKLHGAYLVLSTVITLVVNFTALSILPQTKAVPKHTRLFLISISVANLGNSIPIAMAIYPFFTGHYPLGLGICQFSSSVLLTTFFIASLHFLLCLNVERYIAIRKPLRYPTIVTTRRVRYITGITWFLSISIGIFNYLWRPLPPFKAFIGICVHGNTAYLGPVLELVIFFPFILPTFITTIVYINLLCITHSQIKVMKERERHLPPRCYYTFIEMRNIAIFLTITIVNLLVWIPFLITYYVLDSAGITFSPHHMLIMFWLAASSNWLNMVILMGSNPKCRQEVRYLWTKKFCYRKLNNSIG